MSRQEFIYNGDGIRALNDGEMVGKTLTIKGRRGMVVENGALFITVKWEPWFKTLWRKFFGKR